MERDPDFYYREAKKKVKARKGFYNHLTSYVSVITVLALINIFTSPWHLWFIYPAMGWGIAIVFQYFAVFGAPGIEKADREWEEREIEAEIDRMRNQDRSRQRRFAPDHNNQEEEDDIVPDPPDEELELKEFKKLRKEWDDSDFV